MFYAWAAVAVVPLVIFGVLPSMGPMRRADARAREAGLCVPPEAAHIEAANRSIQPKAGLRVGVWFFVAAMSALVATTIAADNDFLVGLYITLALMLSYLLARRLMNLQESFDTIIDGFKTMLEPLAVLVSAFILKEVNDDLGLATWVVDALQPLLSAELLPAAIFLIMGLVSFLTGSNWGVFVIVLPIVVALGRGLDADMTLLVGATLSASTFGSHACFYSDATVLTAQATGWSPLQHALTQLPYALVAAAIALAAYLVIGYA
jgi:Na+/H+ antiporter NhaC